MHPLQQGTIYFTRLQWCRVFLACWIPSYAGCKSMLLLFINRDVNHKSSLVWEDYGKRSISRRTWAISVYNVSLFTLGLGLYAFKGSGSGAIHTSTLMLSASPSLMANPLFVLLMNHGLLMNFGIYKYVTDCILLLYHHVHLNNFFIEQNPIRRKGSRVHPLCG